MELRPGTILDDTWVIEKSLGTGGMGSVYRAHNRHARKIKAAIKLLSIELLEHPEAKARFVREAEILFGLDHPHIVKVRNVRLDHQPPYIEMEFIEGVSLEQMLQAPPFPYDRALLFTEQLASAVRYLHRHHVYHRDIKPANLLVWKGTMVKLVDFGLALHAEQSERITGVGAHFGTVAYAPPEWIRPQELDPKQWDIYGIGVTLYEMLSGEMAFSADPTGSARQAAVQIMADKQQVPFLDPGPTHPDSLRGLVRKLTAREPEDRIQDAREIVGRLQSVQSEMSYDATTVLASGLTGDELQKAVHERYLEIARPETMHDELNEARSSARLPPGASKRKATAAEPTPPENDRLLWFHTALVVVTLLSMIVLVAAATTGGILAWRTWTSPTLRPLALLVAGVPRQTDLVVTVDGKGAERIDGLQHHFAPLEPGAYRVAWATGPGCDAPPCPAEGCPDTCRVGDTTVSVVDGLGALQLPLELELPPTRAVQLPFPDAPKGTLVLWEDQEAAVADDAVRFAGIAPGTYEIEATAGECPTAERGCADDCPEGCSSRLFDVHVPAQGTIDAPSLALEAPVVARPVPTPRRRSRGPVTRSAYADWMGSHPEWSRENAAAEGRADGSYLQGIDLDARPSAPVTSVPWGAANAYCGGRLARLDDDPQTWSEGAVGLFQEWRSSGGSPAWRRYDGATSSQASPREANAFTGFRCR